MGDLPRKGGKLEGKIYISIGYIKSREMVIRSENVVRNKHVIIYYGDI